MPYSTEYMAEYMLRRYHQRRAEAIDVLGGKCSICGNGPPFDFDHVDRTTKSFDISRLWGCSRPKFYAELKKCQLLCEPCHGRKTTLERGLTPARGTHGTASAAKYCGPPRCEACRAACKETPSYRKLHPNGSTPKAIPEHGTRARYLRKCRCAECTYANTEYTRALVRRNKPASVP